jgi:hypothetical protein
MERFLRVLMSNAWNRDKNDIQLLYRETTSHIGLVAGVSDEPIIAENFDSPVSFNSAVRSGVRQCGPSRSAASA